MNSSPAPRLPPLPDCNHAANGLCSKCVLYRSFDMRASRESSQDGGAGGEKTPAKDGTLGVRREGTAEKGVPAQPPSTSRKDSASSRTGPPPQVMALDAPLTASLAVAGRFRFLPVSTINTGQSSVIPHATSTDDENDVDASTPTTLIGDELSLPSAHTPSFTDLADEAEEVTEAYTSFSELRIDDAKVHRPESSSSYDESTLSPAQEQQPSPLGPPSLLLRMFECEMFNISLALYYLNRQKESGIVSYLGNRLFHLDATTVDFYVPQLVNLLLTRAEVGEAVKPYLVHRCKSSAQFALDCSWLLEAYNHDRTTGALARGFTSEGESLRQLILADFRVDPISGEPRRRGSTGAAAGANGSNGHVRSSSDATLSSHLSSDMPAAMRRVESSLSTLRYLAPGTLPHGRAFDNGCDCFDVEHSDAEEEEQENRRRRDEERECICGADRLRAEQDFIRSLTGIGDRLRLARNKKEKSHRLISELHLLNAHLPARVWIPLYTDQGDHIVLRIPPEGGCVLNSKDKAPYCIYVEVLQCANAARCKVPPRLSECEAELHERLAALTKGGSTPPATNGYGEDASTSTPCGEMGRIPVIECVDGAMDPAWWSESGGVAGELASDSLSQKSLESWNSTEDRTISPADIRRRLKEWVRKPRRQMRHTPDDPSAHAMSEPWDEKRERLRLSSPYGRLPGWQLLPVIVKTGDDLRQELLAYQLLRTLDRIWSEERVELWLRPYKILVLSHDSGMIEPIVNACSLHQIKRNQTAVYAEEGRIDAPSLFAHFRDCFGHPDSESFETAQTNLVRSAAAYSLACYFLQVKDRHNGNILIDSEGHLIHIDFGYILSASPRNLGFETSPFKLTSEIIEVMGGLNSTMFMYYKCLMLKGFLATRKHVDRIMNIVEIMIHGSPLACFRGGPACLRLMRDRFHVNLSEFQLQQHIDHMVESSRDSLTTRLYDNYQYYSNGIL